MRPTNFESIVETKYNVNFDVKILNHFSNIKVREVLESMYSVNDTNSYNRFMKISDIYAPFHENIFCIKF